MDRKTQIKILKSFVSTDLTRHSLAMVWYDGEYYVASDGHRLFATKLNGRGCDGYESGSGKTVQVTFVNDDPIAIPGDYKAPDWRSVSRAQNTSAFKVVVPEYWSGLKNKSSKAKKRTAFPLVSEGVIFFCTGDIQSRGFGFNPSLLAPLAGNEYKALCNVEDAKRPLILVPANFTGTEPTTADYMAVIMPKKA